MYIYFDYDKVWWFIMVMIPYVGMFVFWLAFKRQERNYKERISDLKTLWDEDIESLFNILRKRLEYLVGDGIYVPRGGKHAVFVPGERVPIPKSLRYEIMVRDDFACQLCGRKQVNGTELEVDHKLPVSKGGTNETCNLWTLCDACNSGKSDRILADWVRVEKDFIDSEWYGNKWRCLD